MKKTLEQQLKEARKLYYYYMDNEHSKKCDCNGCLYPKLLEKALRAEKRKVKELQQYKSFYDYKIKRY